MTDPLGLHAFVQRIGDGFAHAAPVAAVGLIVILVVYGLAFRR